MKYLAVIALAVSTGAAQADQYADVMSAYVRDHIRPWVDSEILVTAIRAQNSRTSSLSASDIDELDQRWRAEVGLTTRPTIDPVAGNAASEFLRDKVGSSAGVITEVFLMDGRGLNVAVSEPTSDYWQGDEAKYSETVGKGPGAVHVGEVEFDDSTQTYQGQVSLAITDPASGLVIGALTVGLNAEMLF